MSLSETIMKPTAMFYRNLLAMEVEEILREPPGRRRGADGRVRQDHAGPGHGSRSRGPARDLRARRPDVDRALARAAHWGAAATIGSTGTSAVPGPRAMRSGTRWKTARPLSGTLHDDGHGLDDDGIAEALGHDAARRRVDPGGRTRPSREWPPTAAAGSWTWSWTTSARSASSRRAAFLNAMTVADVPRRLDERGHPSHRDGRPRRGRADARPISMRSSRTTPVIANLRPAGEYLMEDFHDAGGLRRC